MGLRRYVVYGHADMRMIVYDMLKWSKLHRPPMCLGWSWVYFAWVCG